MHGIRFAALSRVAIIMVNTVVAASVLVVGVVFVRKSARCKRCRQRCCPHILIEDFEGGDPANLKAVGLQDCSRASCSIQGRGSRVDHMRVAPAASDVPPSGPRRGSPGLSVVHVQPASTPVIASALTSSLQHVPVGASVTTGTSESDGTRISTGAPSRVSILGLVPPTSGSAVGPAIPSSRSDSSCPSLSALCSQSDAIRTKVGPSHHDGPMQPMRGMAPLPRRDTPMAIGNRFSATVALGRTLVASDMTSIVTTSPMSMPVPPNAPTTSSSATTLVVTDPRTTRAGSARKRNPPVLLVDTVPRGSRCLDLSPGAGSNRVLLPPLVPTPSASALEKGRKTCTSRTGSSTASATGTPCRRGTPSGTRSTVSLDLSESPEAWGVQLGLEPGCSLRLVELESPAALTDGGTTHAGRAPLVSSAPTASGPSETAQCTSISGPTGTAAIDDADEPTPHAAKERIRVAWPDQATLHPSTGCA